MLTDKLKEWAELKKKIDSVEEEIKEEVIALGKSVAYEETHVKFTKAKATIDYQEAVRRVPDGEKKIASIVEHSTPKVTTKWKSVAEDLEVPKDVLDELTSLGKSKVEINLVTK